MEKGDIIKGGLTTTAVGLGGYTAGATTTGIGDGNFWKGFLTLGLVGSVVEGTSGDCSAPEPDVIVRTEDCNDYALTEERAQMIYDKLRNRNINNNDVIPATLYTESPEAAEKLINIMNSFSTREELYIFLTALQKVLEEIIDEENNSKASPSIEEDPKVKKLTK